MNNAGENGSAKRQLNRGLRSDRQSAPRRAVSAHQHTPGLHIALKPARPLGEPDPALLRRCLQRRRGDHVNPLAEARKAQPEIRVLCHIPRVPAASVCKGRAPEMIARATERNRKAEPRQRRHDQAELDRIFLRPLPGEPTATRRHANERRLKTDRIRPGPVEAAMAAFS